MARIKPELLQRLQAKLGIGRSRVYGLVDAKMRQTHLPRHLAAVALASERGISIGRFASEQDLAAMRQAAVAAAPAPVVAPAATAPRARPGRGAPGRRRPREVRRRGTSVFV